MTEHYINISTDMSTTGMCHLKITTYHAFLVHVFVENVDKLDVGWCLYLCVCVVSRAALPVRFAFCTGIAVVSVYDTHESETLGCNWYNLLTVGRKSYVSVEMLVPDIEPLFIIATNLIKTFISLINLKISTQ
jgi:hypothetical protein